MNEVANVQDSGSVAPADDTPSLPTPAELTKREKAAIVLGVLGSDAASPVLEQLNEDMLQSFAEAMSHLKSISPEVVAETIKEFLWEVERMDMTVRGGPGLAREMLSDYVTEETLERIMDDIDSPSVHNVWKKLANVDDGALTEFLAREHSQTVAVVLSKLNVEHAARILGRLEGGRAADVVSGLTKTASLDPKVIDAIGESVSRDFLSTQAGREVGFKPAERVGAIMNYTPGDIRSTVLNFLDENQPEFAEEVKSKMFTFQDFPQRIEKRDVAAVVRASDGDVLLRALAGAADNAPETRDFILSSISSRVAEQIRGDLADLGKVKIREAEEAQNDVLKTVRELETSGELQLIAIEE